MTRLRGPDFFIVGAPKSGTTSLQGWLGANPDLFLAPGEPHYFSPEHQLPWGPTTWDDYVALFEPGQGARRLGEKAVWYLSSTVAPARIAEYSDDPRLIVLLRDPIEAMRSLHGYNLFYGQEGIENLFDALAAEPDRRAGRLIPEGIRAPWHLLYREAVAYATQLARYFSTFGRDRVQVILFEDLRDRPGDTYADACRFLGVAPAGPATFATLNANKVPRSETLQRLLNARRPQWLRRVGQLVPEGPRRRLQARLARANVREQPYPEIDDSRRHQLRLDLVPEISALETLIGRDLSGWKPAESPGAGLDSFR